jgi:hypothetical protein
VRVVATVKTLFARDILGANGSRATESAGDYASVSRVVDTTQIAGDQLLNGRRRDDTSADEPHTTAAVMGAFARRWVADRSARWPD